MKEYIERRIRELKQEKEYWLTKMDSFYEEIYKNEYLKVLYKLDELYDLQCELIKKYGEEYEKER